MHAISKVLIMYIAFYIYSLCISHYNTYLRSSKFLVDVLDGAFLLTEKWKQWPVLWQLRHTTTEVKL